MAGRTPTSNEFPAPLSHMTNPTSGNQFFGIPFVILFFFVYSIFPFLSVSGNVIELVTEATFGYSDNEIQFLV